MSRHHLSPEAQIELLRRQYFQLIDPPQLTFPADSVLKAPEIQSLVYRTMFRPKCHVYPPPDQYRSRVLKRLLEAIERAAIDPVQDEISDDLTDALAALVVVPKAPPEVVAQQWNCITYTTPSALESMDISRPPMELTLLESQNIIASQGTTGRRTWEAALHLGTFLLQQPQVSQLAGSTVIELGAGTGFLSILATKFLRTKYVLSTDGSSEVVENLATNLHLNQLDNDPRIQTAVLKWGHSLDSDVLNGSDDEPRDYDLVLGSDLIYDRDAVLPLVITISQLFSRRRDLQAIISATVRNEATLKLFEDTCGKEGMNVEQLLVPPQEPLRQEGLFHSVAMPIRVYSIKLAGEE